MFLFFVFLKDSQSSSTLPKLSICGNLKSRLDLFTWHNITILLQEAKDSQPHTPCTRVTLCLYQPALIFTIHFFLYFYNTFCVSGSSSEFFFSFLKLPIPYRGEKKILWYCSLFIWPRQQIILIYFCSCNDGHKIDVEGEG